MGVAKQGGRCQFLFIVFLGEGAHPGCFSGSCFSLLSNVCLCLLLGPAAKHILEPFGFEEEGARGALGLVLVPIDPCCLHNP